MNNFLETLAKIPLPRVIIITLLAMLAFVLVEQLPWAQSFFEHLINMEALK